METIQDQIHVISIDSLEIPLGDSYYDTMLMDMSVFEAGLKAEEEGFDAVCIDTVSDSGMYALRSKLNIPVVGPGQASFHIACCLGHKFSVITMWDEWEF